MQKIFFFICKDDESEHYFNNFVYELIDEFHPSNEQLLYRFFNKLLRADMDYLDCLETEMNNKEAELLSGRLRNTLEEIINWQRELLRLKHYYEQLDTVFDEMSGNDNDLLSPAALKHILILGARTDRYLNKVDNMRELASQMHATYQAQLSIQQNDFMKVFTVVTAVFLPLTLLVGWYGMNFTYMPELHWQYSYPVVIASSAGIVIFLIWFFKHKKWL